MTGKHLKFGVQHIEAIREGEKSITVRLGLERDFRPGDKFDLLDEDGEKFATARVDWTGEMTAARFHADDWAGHRSYERLGEFLGELQRYYPNEDVSRDSEVFVVSWESSSVVEEFGYDDRAAWSRPEELE